MPTHCISQTVTITTNKQKVDLNFANPLTFFLEWLQKDPSKNPKIAGALLVGCYILLRIFETFIIYPAYAFQKNDIDDDGRLKLKPGSTIVKQIDGHVYMNWKARARITKKGYLIIDNPPFDWAGHQTNRTFYLEVPPGSKRHVDGFFCEDVNGEIILEYARRGQPLDIIPKMMGVRLNGDDKGGSSKDSDTEVCYEAAAESIPSQSHSKGSNKTRKRTK